MNSEYVLITTAHNEAGYIATVIESVAAQTVLPRKWIIVDDASEDATPEIVSKCAAQYPFMELHRIRDRHPRDFGAQCDAFSAGYARLQNMRFRFIGNLDADVALPPDYYQTVLQKFTDNLRLGLAGGYIHEDEGKGFQARRTNSRQSVAGAIQVFRRECYEAIGGYPRLPYGGSDWATEIMSRQRGWIVEAFPELVVRHYRPAGSAGGVLRGHYRQGRMDHSLGSLPLFEAVKCLRRIPEQPFLAGALSRMLGFAYSYLARAPRLLPPEVVCELRDEQRGRLRSMAGMGQGVTAEPRLLSPSSASSKVLPKNARLSD